MEIFSTVQVKFKGKQKIPVFIAFLGLKYFGGFKGKREVSLFQVRYRSQFLQTSVFFKDSFRENPSKNGEFLVGF